uniref:DET1- and DDB1-associated protein 1 domain-containing protein n=1 Tax=Oryza nivara TaxID=4536 RepID=A0A0E0J9U9_ORYNI
MGADGGGGGGRKSSSPAGKPAEAARAGSLLAGLPSRGNFVADSIASSMGGLPIYVCLHDTAPPEGQVIDTDTTNILIRSLQLSKQKNEAKDVGSRTPGESSKGKRSASRLLDGKNPSKRANTGSTAGSSAHGELGSVFSEQTLQSFTVEKLRILLKERGLSPKGKKVSTENA